MSQSDLTPLRLGFRPYLDGYEDPSLQLQLHVYRRSEEQFARWERHKDQLADAAQVAAWQQQVRTVALAAIGGLPEDDSPLEPEHLGTLAGDGFDVEKLIFQSLPRVYVTANLYRPRSLFGPTGAVLFLCGHAEAAKTYPEYQDVCQRLARNGLIVLAMDPIGQGERKSYLDERGQEIIRWGTEEHTYAGVPCWWLGHSIARYFIHDARRALDYLASRPEVDPARLGVTGNSGGGTQTTWLMLLEPRLAAAAPGTFVTRRREYLWTGQAQDAEQIIVGGTARGLDHEDFLIAFAPRPVRVLAVDYDFFNLEGTVATVKRARRIYRLLGHGENLDLIRTPAGHCYHPALARAATSFFVQHLRGGDPAEVDHREPCPFPPQDLWCTRSGQVLLDRPETRRVFDLNQEAYARLRAEALARSRGSARAEEARAWLAARVHQDRCPADFFPRWLPGPPAEGLEIWHGYWSSERDVRGAGVLLQPPGGAYESLILALFDRGTADLNPSVELAVDQAATESADHPEAALAPSGSSDPPFRARTWALEQARAGQAVLALDVRGTGALAPHPINPRPPEAHYGTFYKLLTDLLALGDSLAAMRIYDILRAVQLVRTDPKIALGDRPLRLFGAGRGAYLGYLAAALEPAIDQLELIQLPASLAPILTNRLYPAQPGWQDLIPGQAIHADLPDLQPLVARREQRIERS